MKLHPKSDMSTPFMYNMGLNYLLVNFKLINHLNISCHRKHGLYDLITKLNYAPPPSRAVDGFRFAFRC